MSQTPKGFLDSAGLQHFAAQYPTKDAVYAMITQLENALNAKVSTTSYNETQQAVTNSINSINSSISSHDTAIQSMNSDIGDINSSISSINSDISDINTALEDTASIEQLDTAIDSVFEIMRHDQPEIYNVIPYDRTIGQLIYSTFIDLKANQFLSVCTKTEHFSVQAAESLLNLIKTFNWMEYYPNLCIGNENSIAKGTNIEYDFTSSQQRFELSFSAVAKERIDSEENYRFNITLNFLLSGVESEQDLVSQEPLRGGNEENSSSIEILDATYSVSIEKLDGVKGVTIKSYETVWSDNLMKAVFSDTTILSLDIKEFNTVSDFIFMGSDSSTINPLEWSQPNSISIISESTELSDLIYIPIKNCKDGFLIATRNNLNIIAIMVTESSESLIVEVGDNQLSELHITRESGSTINSGFYISYAAFEMLYTAGPCETCSGTGVITTSCNHCGGDGYTSESCSTCGGSGNDSCSMCGGSGEVPCEECGGTGRIVTCSTCDGSGLMPCSTCDSSGIMPGTEDVPCEDCDGTGYENCQNCDGTGQEICSSCQGSGHISCPTCGGTGLERCSTCNGSGTADESCEECGGTGDIEETCPDCDGTGNARVKSYESIWRYSFIDKNYDSYRKLETPDSTVWDIGSNYMIGYNKKPKIIDNGKFYTILGDVIGNVIVENLLMYQLKGKNMLNLEARSIRKAITDNIVSSAALNLGYEDIINIYGIDFIRMLFDYIYFGDNIRKYGNNFIGELSFGPNDFSIENGKIITDRTPFYSYDGNNYTGVYYTQIISNPNIDLQRSQFIDLKLLLSEFTQSQKIVGLLESVTEEDVHFLSEYKTIPIIDMLIHMASIMMGQPEDEISNNMREYLTEEGVSDQMGYGIQLGNGIYLLIVSQAFDELANNELTPGIYVFMDNLAYSSDYDGVENTDLLPIRVKIPSFKLYFESTGSGSVEFYTDSETQVY